MTRCILCFLLLFTAAPLVAQNHDTLAFYKRIKKKAYKHKFTKYLYHAVFVDPSPKRYERKPLSDKQYKENPYFNHKGKIIRKIYVNVYDPFGYAVNDTFRKDINKLQEAGNTLHVTTRQWVIRNLLLFKEQDTVDVLSITESERILREVGYINDARIYLMGIPGSDSVDVRIIALDRWTIDVPTAFSATDASILLRDRNLAGLGQRFEQSVRYNAADGTVDFGSRYYINNLDHMYISSEIFYTKTRDLTQYGFAFDRPFYSPLASWAGGITANKTQNFYNYTDTENVVTKYPQSYYYYDVWGGKTLTPSRKRTPTARGTNLIAAFRHARTYFTDRPPITIDTNQVNVHTSLYLGSVAYSLRKYYKDQFIYRFGANEDIPEGWNVQWLYGWVQQEVKGKDYYTGFEISRAKHFQRLGYLSANVTYGTFFDLKKPYSATWNAGAFYFSDLLTAGSWYFRQFVNYKLVYGINKAPYERIAFQPQDLYGFNSGAVNGTAKTLLNIESVAYAPYNIIGFRFAPVLLMGFGMIGNNISSVFQGVLYQSYAVGLLIRNENLITNTFQVTVGFYPNQPGQPPKLNLSPVFSFTLRVRNFAVGKPDVVAFQ